MIAKIVLADDHPIVRSGILSVLVRRTDLEVVGQALNGDEALQMTLALQPDVLILDINMPGKRAVDVVRVLNTQLPSCKILVLSAYSDSPTVIGMLKAGVSGYVLKDDEPQVLLEAISVALDGEIWLSQALSDRLAEFGNGNREFGAELSKREMEVLRYAAKGSTNRDISVALRMGERTVEYHMTHVLRKLGVKGRLEAVVKAKELGYL